MIWNPPDPSDLVQQKLALYDELDDLSQHDARPYEIRVFHADRTPIIEEFDNEYDFEARIDDLACAGTEYEIICGPEEIPF